MKKPKEYFHALKVINENCVGCTACVRVCPTEAIRLRNDQIKIDAHKCIDCGNCITACNYDALRPISDNLMVINRFKYRVAVLSYCFAGQFPEYVSYDKVKETLSELGFDYVADEAEATESLSLIIKDYIKNNEKKKPILSSNCPAVVRLIQFRFPSLLNNLLLLESPANVLARYYRNKISKEKGIPKNQIGVFAIVPCIAQVTSAYQPEGVNEMFFDGAISVKDIYNKMMSKLFDEDDGTDASYELGKGHSWAIPGKEADIIASDDIKSMAVTGIKNVIKILSKIENQQIDKFDYVVLKSCINGCMGGGLNVENPFVGTSRILRHLNSEYRHKLDKDYFFKLYEEGQYDVQPLEPRSIMELDKDIKQAISKMKKVNQIVELLPGINCCACGSPSCQALAEDIVQGKATLDDCLVRLKRSKDNK